MSESDSVMVMIWTESLGMVIWLFSALHALSLVQIFLQIGKMTQKGELLTHAPRLWLACWPTILLSFSKF